MFDNLERKNHRALTLFTQQEMYDARYKNLGIAPTDTQKIPATLYHIWLTSSDKPKDISSTSIEQTIKTALLLAKDTINNWKIEIWTNNLQVITEAEAKLSPYNVTFRHISELYLTGAAKDNIDYTLDKQYWGMASDALRYIIVSQFGGFYADLGAEFHRAPGLDLYRYDFLANQWQGTLSANNFFAAKPHHPALIKTSEIVEENLQKFRTNNNDVRHSSIKDLTTDLTAEPFNTGFYYHFLDNLFSHEPTIDVVIPHSRFHNNKDLYFDGIDPKTVHDHNAYENNPLSDICAADELFIGQDALAGESWYAKADRNNSNSGNEELFVDRYGNAIESVFKYLWPKLVTKMEHYIAATPAYNALRYQHQCMSQPTISHNVHYIWLTNPTNSREASPEHLKYVTESMAVFRNQTKYTDWSYQFHTNAPLTTPITVEFFKIAGFSIIDITTEYKNFITGTLADVFVQYNKFGLAADLARYEILNNEGGLYLDLNFNLARALDHEVCAYSYVNFRTMHHFQHNWNDFPGNVENYFLLSRNNHPILEQSIDDIYSAFNGANAKGYWQNLNATTDGMTQAFFSEFTTNNEIYLTTNGEPGIIYTFNYTNSRIYEDRYVDSREMLYLRESYMDMRMPDEHARMFQEYARRFQEFEELRAQNPRNDVCTNTDLILQFGNDGDNGRSWMVGETSVRDF